eukprot:m.126702 g.126702  ORF g.126702 m.126702 type:complete len:339 (+) comp13841_c0_seq1:33-1049(+)
MGGTTPKRAVVAALFASTLLVLAQANNHQIEHDPQGYIFHDHCVQHPYMSNGMDIPNWDFSGSTVVTDDYIRLTPDRQSRRGALWNKIPYNPPIESKYPWFDVTLAFNIHGQGKKLFGDGLAFWYTQNRMQQGPVFGNQDMFVGLGIFFDTYSNVQQGHQQYISVMVGDGKTHYDHENDGGNAKIAGCAMQFRGREDDPPVYARIVYQDTLLRVYVDSDGEGFEECFVLRRVYLKRGWYFGVTAATGDLADNHDILSIKVGEAVEMTDKEKADIDERIARDKAHPENIANKGDPQYVQEPEGGSMFGIIAVVIVVLGVAGVGGFLYFGGQKKKAKFDF